MKTSNIFAPAPPDAQGQEFFETLLESPDVRIERIIELHPFKQEGEWYNQEEDEWVILLRGQADLEIKNEGIQKLSAGDYLFIPAHKIHRIKRTGNGQTCVWLAVFVKFK